MNTDAIQPRDLKETSVLALCTKIAIALGTVATLLTGLLTSVQGVKWFTTNLPSLISGITALISGGVVTGIALRRMKIDKAAKTLLLVLSMAVSMLLQGCVFTQVEIPLQGTVVKIKRVALCNAVEIPKVSYIPSTGEILIEGYKSDGGAATMEAVAKGSAEGAVRGLKGTSGL